jgi:UDP-N-acetylmuramate--alanine ligase
MNLNRLKYVHFIGIGGIGMSALARYFNQMGVRVSGYDRMMTDLTKELIKEGVDVYHDESPAYVGEVPDLIVYTPAIPEDHIEFEEARNQGVPLMKRASVLGLIAEEFRTVAVAGTHGKTTTSTMLASILKNSGVDTTVFLGGISRDYNSNYHLGKSDWMVTEADEFDRSFLMLHPEIVILNSLDPDHLDIYRDLDDMIGTYAKFIRGIKEDGVLLIKEGLPDSLLQIDACVFDNIVVKTFGKSEEADYRLDSLEWRKGKMYLKWDAEGAEFESQLSVAGEHNAMNAMAAMAAGMIMGNSGRQMSSALSEFKGIQRRFEKRYDDGDFVIIDDYAHHPSEVEAAIKATRFVYPDRKLIGVFQSHLYSRTRDFMDEFARSLGGLDAFYSCELYPAREEPIEGVSGKVLFDKVEVAEKTFCKKEELPIELRLSKGDVVLVMGAGNIDSIIPELIERIGG